MNSIWKTAREILAAEVSDPNYKIWIEPLQPLRMENGALYLGCPNRFFMAWVREKYLDRIKSALDRANGGSCRTAELVLAPVPDKDDSSDAPQRQRELPVIEAVRRAPLRFNRRFTFDSFVVGSTNQYAYSAAWAMARGNELNTDLLYLLADPGLGKSHLSQAIGQHLLTAARSSRVFYLTAEDFTNELVYSLRNKCVDEFKNKYRRECDVLVLEGVHFLSGKEKVQAELAYTLDCLIENRKKVIFTSSSRPRDIPRMVGSLSSRLAGSLISCIEPPDYKTRLKILDRKASEAGLNAPPQVLEFMAEKLGRDVRQLESAINNVGAKSRLLQRPLDVTLAREALADLIDSTPAIAAEAIRDLVCRHYRVSVEDLKSRSRRKQHVMPRNMGMYLCRKMTDLSLEAIGRLFGRNHSTVLYSVNLVENRCRRDSKLKSHVEFLSERVQEQGGASA